MSQAAQIQLYIDQEDFRQIVQLLDSDEEIAYLLNQGKGQWCAYHVLPKLNEFAKLNRFSVDLWHIPAGGVPLQSEAFYFDAAKQPTVPDPFKGWHAWDALNNKHIDHIGSHPTVLSLEICFLTKNHGEDDIKIGRSRLFWIAGRYETSLKEGLDKTRVWWRRFKGKLTKISHRIPIGNDPKSKGIDHLALSSAYNKIQKGQKCSKL